MALAYSSVKQGMGERTTQKRIVKNSGASNELPVKPAPFTVPDGLLTQLNECSSGGFILITSDGEGQPRIYSRHDTLINAIGLLTFGTECLKAQSNILSQAILAGRLN